jgi:phosphoribosylformimino-5-aminoimidazole carboxamide ribonucleotide (ProFAR) isomerase
MVGSWHHGIDVVYLQLTATLSNIRVQASGGARSQRRVVALSNARTVQTVISTIPSSARPHLLIT